MGNDSLNYSNLKFLFSMSMCLYVIHDSTTFLAFIFIVLKIKIMMKIMRQRNFDSVMCLS